LGACGDGLLRCAERLHAQGRTAEALALYGRLQAAPFAGHVAVAAWRGAVVADAPHQVERLLAALADPAAATHPAAVALLHELPPASWAAACLARWDALPATAQFAVLGARGGLGAEALPTFRRAVRSPHPAVRTEAWRALVDLPDPTLVLPAATAAAQAEADEREAARAALAAFDGADAVKALLAALPTQEPPVQAELLRALGTYREPEAAAALLLYAQSKPGPARTAALEAIAGAAPPALLQPLLDLALGTAAGAERTAVVQAAKAVCRTTPDRDAATTAVLAAVERVPAAERREFLALLTHLPTPRALDRLQDALRGGDLEMAREAARALEPWPDTAPATSLLEVARATTDGALNALALRAVTALATRAPDAVARTRLLAAVLAAARRPDEKRLALAGLQQSRTPEAFRAVVPALDDASVADEAAVAALTIAEALGPDQAALVEPAMARIVATASDGAVRARAILRGAKPQPGPFVRHWRACGPFTQTGAARAQDVFDVVFPPETQDGQVAWQAATTDAQVDLIGLYPGKTAAAAYVQARLTSPAATDALLLLGSDDGIKAWLNGAVVSGNNTDRPLAVDQDAAAVKLRQGTNELMLKVTQGAGGWAVCARFVGTNGAPIPGLVDEPWPGTALAIAPTAPPPAPAPAVVPADLPPRAGYRKVVLFTEFYAEGAYYADLNRDGKMDVIAGPFWFEGPDVQKRHEYRPVKAFDPKGYSDNFLTYAGDFNGDGWSDILCVPFPGAEGFWYENPKGADGHWQKHLAYNKIGNESPVWGDVSGGGRPELLFNNDGFLGYAAPDPAAPMAPWPFHAISGQDSRYQQFTHGVGLGDVNGDGRSDILEAVGWWEQPPAAPPGQPWTFRPQRFAEAGAQILATDLDGDGLTDVVSAWHCHLYGLNWYRQTRDAGGQIQWQQHEVLSANPNLATAAFRPSELHALELVDMNGDGVRDILTGKRFWAHGPTGDKEADAPAVVFWYEVQRDGPGAVRFVPRLVDDDSGVGTQVAATDLDGDERPDVIVANKKGGFVHFSRP
jgi:HEAT repeat protein